MSVSSTNYRNNYIGNGATSVYPYTFKIFDQTQLEVKVRLIATGVETTLTLTTDYTVSGALASGGGNVTLVNSGQAWLSAGSLLSTYALSIRRVLPLTQLTSIRNQSTYYPEIHEDQFDRAVMIEQQIQGQIDASLRMATSVDPATFNPVIPATYYGANRPILMLNSTGTALEATPYTLANLISAIVLGGPFTTSRVLQTNSATGLAEASAVTNTELSYLSGTTSAIQTQIDSKQPRTYATTVTAAGTTVLTVASAYQQYFTGSTTQTVTLPVASTMTLGYSFLIVNSSSGVVTVNSSGANLVQALAAGTWAQITCILASGTSAASWSVTYDSISTLPATMGGTGITTYTTGDIPYASATNVLSKLPASTAGYGLQTNGAGTAPTWVPKAQGSLSVLTATSSVKTATASGNFSAMTGNSLPLTVGTWRLDSATNFTNPGSTPTYAAVGMGCYSTNGADSGAVPTLLTATSNLTVNSALPAYATLGLNVLVNSGGAASDVLISSASIIVTVTATVTLYVVPYAVFTTAANTRITTYFTAQRLY